jgi:hypothetical protein
MAYNPRLEVKETSSTLRNKSNVPNPFNSDVAKKPKQRYYVEWWNYGDRAEDIRSGECFTNNIKHVLTKLISGGNRSVVYVRRLSDGKVLRDRT